MQCHLKLCVKMKPYIHPVQYELIESDIMTTVFIDYVSLGLFSLWPSAKKSCQFNHTQLLPTYRFWAARWMFDKKPCFRKPMQWCVFINQMAVLFKSILIRYPNKNSFAFTIVLYLYLHCCCILFVWHHCKVYLSPSWSPPIVSDIMISC